MRFISEFKKEFNELLGRVSLREITALIGGGVSGALVWIIIDLNLEEMAVTGQWLPPENSIFLLASFFVGYCLMLILPLILLYRKTNNDGSDERDNDIYIQTAANGFYILQGLLLFALFWYIRHGDGLLLYNSIIISFLTSTMLFFTILAIRYRIISAPLLPMDDA